MTAWEGADGNWMQSLAIDFSGLSSSKAPPIPNSESACNEEISRLRGKSSSLKKKVRKANEEEKREKLRITALDKEIAGLEEKLALRLQDVPRPGGL